MALTHEELFLFTLCDLRERVSKGTEYDLLRACGLCRQLFVENGSLFNILNKKNKYQISFTVIDWGEMKNLRAGITWMTPNPKNKPNSNTKSLTINQFKNHVLLSINKHQYKVEEIIRGVSHFMGGVHIGVPKNEKEKVFSKIETIILDKEVKIITYAIKAISEVVLTAMEPIEIEIKNRTTNR